MMDDIRAAMQTVDDAVNAARASARRRENFALLRKTLLRQDPINVAVHLHDVRADRHRLQAPFRIVERYSPDAQIAIFGANGVFANRDRVERYLTETRDCLFVVWTSVNHHIYVENMRLCEQFHVAIPAHSISLDYLYATSAIITSPVPCPCNQWLPEDIALYFETYLEQPRSNALYGGFRQYDTKPRNALIREIMNRVPDNDVKLLSPEQQKAEGSYFRLSAEEQIADWMRYKTSIVVCVKNDIPMRLFDALMTGQIPIVPWDMVGLDTVISPEDQAWLPILRYDRDDIGEIASRRDAAVRAFDRDGRAGILRRHRYALERHTMVHRARTMLSRLEDMARLT